MQNPYNIIRIPFFVSKIYKEKDKIGNTILSLAQGVNKRNNHHIFIILQLLLILNIKTIIDKYIYIEKFITKLAIRGHHTCPSTQYFGVPPKKNLSQIQQKSLTSVGKTPLV
ncbi:hypothetical protein CN374_27590 [Bacillus cereus]|nr:hypothetical protein CN374_27590 [Bacillus cereus]